MGMLIGKAGSILRVRTQTIQWARDQGFGKNVEIGCCHAKLSVAIMETWLDQCRGSAGGRRELW
jgi:hypothetical protein